MPFNSLRFFLVFPVIFGVYWAIPARCNLWRKLFLILASYLLYMNWNPAFAIVLLGVTLVTFWGGLVCGGGNEKGKRHLIWVFAILGLLPLLVFKYYNFLNDNVSAGLSALGLGFSLPGLNWAVPVGISFFTFQAVGYMLDVYHGRVKAERNLVDYLLFVSFFPQITSGPISRADELLPQIKRENTFNYSQAVSGMRYLLWGMFLKVVIADRAGIYVDTVFDSYERFSGAGCAIAAVLYSFQIYADFAGYSLMAIGVSKTLGFDLVENFNRPYLAASVSEFWRRWHISLTRWLTRHVYIPLGGNRRGTARTYLNILITFLVSGIWHGANWTFIVWGCLHGLFLIVERIFGWQRKDSKGLVKASRVLVTFVVVTLAWVVFRSPSISDAAALFGRFAADGGQLITKGSVGHLIYCLSGLLFLLSYESLKEYFPESYNRLANRKGIRWATYLVLFSMILLIGVLDGSSFIYVGF